MRVFLKFIGIIFLFLIFYPIYSFSKSFSIYEDVKYHEYENGFKFLWKKIPTEIIGISLLINSGSSDEAEFQGSGVAHMVEHLAFESRKDLDKRFRKLGAIVNAYTSFDYTLYHIEVSKQNWQQALKLLISALYHPQFTEEAFQQEQKVILKEMKFRDDRPQSLLAKLLFEKSYNTSSYKYPVIGYKYLFLNLKLEDVIKYHDRNYIPNNSYLAIVGNISDDVGNKVGEMINNLKPKPKGLHFRKELIRGFPIKYNKSYPGKLVYFSISFPGISTFHSDLEAFDLLAYILAEGKDSIFYKELVEKEVVYNINCYNYTLRQSGLFIVEGLVSEENFKDAIDKIKTIVKQNYLKINNKKLNRIKKEFVLSHLKTLESPLGMAINLSVNQAIYGDYRFDERYLEKIEEIDLKDLEKVFRKYLVWDRRTTVELVPEKPKKEKVKENKIKYKSKYNMESLSNGLRVILGENKLVPLVSVTAVFNGGLRVENKFNNGITRLLINTMMTKTLSAKIQKLGGEIDSFSGNNSFGFKIEVPKDNLDKSLKILAKNLIKPKLNKKDFSLEKKKMIAELKDLEIKPFYQAEKLLRMNLFKNYPYKFMPEGREKSVSKIKFPELKDYISKYMKPNNCVISIAGDIDSNLTSKLARKYFSKWESGVFKINPPEEKGKSIKNLFKKEIATREVIVMIGYKVPNINSPQSPIEDLLSELFNGSGTKFYQEIRKQLQAAYTLGSYILKGPDTGMFVIYIATTSDKLNEVNKKLNTIISSLDEYLTKDMLKDAEVILKTEFEKRMISNSDIGFRLALDELLRLGYNYYKRYLKEIEKIKLDDLQKFIEKYISPSKSVTVWVGKISKKDISNSGDL
jgi:zinc protease